jgi:rubrerythrin
MKTFDLAIPSDCIAIYRVKAKSRKEAIRLTMEGEADFVRNINVQESSESESWTITEMPLKEPATDKDVEMKIRSFYRCPECDYEWDDTWDSACDDECPECGTKNISPYNHEDLEAIR